MNKVFDLILLVAEKAYESRRVSVYCLYGIHEDKDI
jgi:hypothetical protein